MKNKIVIFVEDGLIQNIVSNVDTEVRIVDRDTEGTDDDRLITVGQKDALVYGSIRETEVNPDIVEQIYAQIESQE